MWATFKSDLQEFAAGAAEETSAVANKVGATIVSDADTTPGGGVCSRDVGGFATSPPTTNKPREDGSVLFAKAAFSMGDKGLKGLQGVSSMIRNTAAAAAVTTNNSSSAASSFASSTGGKPSAALSSMLAQAEDDDEEEEELGWDDDDDDLDVEEESIGVVVEADDNKSAGPTDNFFEEQLGPTDGGGENNPPASLSSPNNQVLTALQSKLDAVEKARAELQIDHRSQTAELVELRAKVEELEKNHDTAEEGSSKGNEEEFRTLEEEIARLKLQLSEQPSKGYLLQEHEKVVTGLIQEKATLEQELKDQRKHHDKIQLHASQDKASSSSDTQDLLLQEYHNQIKELTSTSQSLLTTESTEGCKVDESTIQSQEQLNHAKQTEQLLLQMKDYHTLALKEAQESKAKLAAAEEELQNVKAELEAQAASFAVRLKEETAKAGAQQQQEKEEVAATASTSVAAGGAPLTDSSETATDEENASSNSSPIKVDEEDELSDAWGADGEELSDDWGEDGDGSQDLS